MKMKKATAGAAETAVLDKLLQHDFPGAKELREQAVVARIVRVQAGGSPALLFEFDDPPSRADVRSRVPVEGEFGDEAGLRIHCLLHVVDGRLKELEFFREDGAPVTELPPAREMRVLRN